MRPIFSIDDFSRGISYDETENTVNGFNDIVQVDLKTINGVMMLSKDYLNTVTGDNDTREVLNHMKELQYVPDAQSTGNDSSALYLTSSGSGSATVNLLDPNTNSVSQLVAGWSGAGLVNYAEVATFQNRIFWARTWSGITSAYVWTTGNRKGITANGTTTVSVTSLSGWAYQRVDKAMEGGKIRISSGTSFTEYGIVSVDTSLQTITLDTSIPSGTYYAYSYTFAEGVKPSDGSSTYELKTPSGTAFYRPLAENNAKLYVGDGNWVYSLDSNLTNSVSAGDLSSGLALSAGSVKINLGTDWMAKQIKVLNGYLYILADRVNVNMASIIESRYSESAVFVWDGLSTSLSSVVPAGTHVFAIHVAENRLYALLQSNLSDGLYFSYFNGSDFPTIAKFQLPNAYAYVSSITYDRGRFYFAVNASNTPSWTDEYVFSYSAYAVEKPCVTKEFYKAGKEMKMAQVLKFSTKTRFVWADNWSGSGWRTLHYKSDTFFTSSGYVESQKYEIAREQFGVLIKGVQLNFRETLAAGCSVDVAYKVDEETGYTTLGNVSSTNQNGILWGMNRRARKIRFRLTLQTNSLWYSPQIVKINLY